MTSIILVSIVIICCLGAIWFITKKLKAVFNYNHYIDNSFVNDIERQKKEVTQKIKESSAREISNRLKNLFMIPAILSLILLNNCCGRLAVIPEPPQTPRLSFDVCGEKVCFAQGDDKKLLEYMELSKIYRERLLKFLDELK